MMNIIQAMRILQALLIQAVITNFLILNFHLNMSMLAFFQLNLVLAPNKKFVATKPQGPKIPAQNVPPKEFPTKRPLPIRNCILGLAAIYNWACIGNETFGIKKPTDCLGAIEDDGSNEFAIFDESSDKANVTVDFDEENDHESNNEMVGDESSLRNDCDDGIAESGQESQLNNCEEAKEQNDKGLNDTDENTVCKEKEGAQGMNDNPSDPVSKVDDGIRKVDREDASASVKGKFHAETYAKVAFGKQDSFSRKLTAMPTEIDDEGNEFAIFDENIINEGCKKWDLTVCGYFVGHNMSVNELRYNLRKMWGWKGFKDIIDMNKGVYFIKFNNEKGLEEIVNSGPQMVNNKPFFVQKWDIHVNLDKREPKQLPIWIRMCNVPLEAWTSNGISALASRLGKPLVMDNVTVEMCKMGVGRVGYARVNLPCFSFIMATITSIKCVLTQEHLDSVCIKYFVPEEVHPQLPGPDNTMHERPSGKVGMYTRFFDYANYRIPFSNFFVSVLVHFRIPFSQLSVFGSAKTDVGGVTCLVLKEVVFIVVFDGERQRKIEECARSQLLKAKEESVVNQGLVSQVHELETSSARLREQLDLYEGNMKRLEEFQDNLMGPLKTMLAEIDADFTRCCMRFQESFHLHLLNVVAGRRWLLTHGMKLLMAKCLNSTEYMEALGNAFGRAIEKGMQEGLAAGIEHEQAGRCLTDLEAYIPSAEVVFNSVVSDLRGLNFSLLRELSNKKDASTWDIMDLLR
ncbi:zinc knuckle CX2CX4HX4C containing protein [Tanacetum coccineum]